MRGRRVAVMLRETCTLALLPMPADLSRDLAGDATLSAVSGLGSPRADDAIDWSPPARSRSGELVDVFAREAPGDGLIAHGKQLEA